MQMEPFFFFSYLFSIPFSTLLTDVTVNNMKKRSHPRDYSLVTSREGMVERHITLNVHSRIK